MPKFTMRLRSVGNPDYSQYAPISNPETVTGDTLQEMLKAHNAYVEKWNMGCGNHVSIAIKDAATGKPVAWISYNGCLWVGTLTDWNKAKEISI
jgi:hypothetical protein